MTKYIRSFFFLILFGTSPLAFAQLITTQAIATNAVCAGSTIEVPFTSSGLSVTSMTAYTVQLANGNGAFVNVPTSAATQNGAAYTITATIPASLTYSNAYRVRVVSSSVLGTVSPTTLTVKTLPGAPAVPLQLVAPNTYQYTFCQNDKPVTLSDITGPVPDNYRVQYDFGSGAAPTSQKTFTAPTITTATPSKATYNLRFVVTDASRGCNPGNDAVAYLQTEVKLRPDVPSVPNPTLTYCLNSNAPALAAYTTVANANLAWYDASDKLLSETTAPVPPTSQPGTQTYQVVQSVNGCESPKVRLTVAVQTTPVPAVGQTRLDVCKGSTTQPLSATGTNLRWTDPTGTTFAAAPMPSTSEVTKSADGDIYYVTQTGSNGCVSPRVAIRVFVLGPPTLALSGSTTVTLGQTATLTLTFTGNGPYRFRLSNGLSGTAQKDTTVRVTPSSTTVYQVAEVSNNCGTGLPTSSATITVQVPSIRTLPLSASVVCAGSPVTANFQATGGFNAGNTFRVRIARIEAGTTALTYTDLTDQRVGIGQVTGTLPATLAVGTYSLVVVSTNPDISTTNTTTPTQIAVRAPASATLSATPNPAQAGELVKLNVTLGGEGPWTFSYRDSSNVVGTAQQVTTNANPHSIELHLQRTTAYRLTALSNGCGNAPGLPAPLVVTVLPLLATEPLRMDGLTESVRVFPIPATSALTVQFAEPLTESATLDLLDMQGKTKQQHRIMQTTTTVPLTHWPAGTYLLRIRVGEQTTVRRILVE
ncbi:T9SS type A sorting domain-containing protein [Fibrella sp. WM1]|uniref:T9SS type A sorting domain-containing protein n=1 Tax=Fibrella musci TaxID=3242485 RepID=UPI0035226644